MTLLSLMLADSPWGLWRAADASGLSAPDASGNGHDGTLSGSGVTIDPSGLHLAEPCFTFDGSGGSITIPGAVDLPAGDYTLVAALTSSLGGGSRGGVVGYGQWGSTDFTNYLVIEGTTVLHSVWYSNDLDDTVSGLGAGAHVVATRFDGTTRQAWLDAAAVGSGDTPGSPAFDLTQNVLIGLDGGSESFDGKIDYIAIYPTKLSDARLAAYHTALIAAAPNAPTGLTATPNTSTGAIDLAWTAPASGPTPDSYTIERSTTSGAEVSYHTGVVGTSYADIGVVVGTHYYYKVRSVTVAAGDGGLSGEADAIAPAVVVRTVQLTDTIVNGALVPQVGVTVTATLSVQGGATAVDSTGRLIDLTPLTDVSDSAGTYVIDAASGEGVVAPADIKQNSGGTLIPLPGCAWVISYLSTTIVSPEFAWSGTPIHPSSWVAPFETIGRFKMWLTDINGNGVARPGVTFGCSVNANTTWIGGSGAGQLVSSSGQFPVTTDDDGNIFLWVIRVSEFADAGRYYNLVELAGGSGFAATFVAPDLYTNDRGVYAGGTTYAAGDVVRRAVDDVPFISQAGSNTGHALTDPTWWSVYNGEKVTLNTFLVGAAGTQVATEAMIATSTFAARHHASPTTVQEHFEEQAFQLAILRMSGTHGRQTLSPLRQLL